MPPNVPAPIPPTPSSGQGKRSRSAQGRGKSRVTSKPYVEIDDEVKTEEVERPLPPVVIPDVKRRAKTADTDVKPRFPHNVERPPFPHNGEIPPPGSDLRKDMLTCDSCWWKRHTNPSLECILVNGRRACLACGQSKVKCSRCPEGKRGPRNLTEEEELTWRIFGRLNTHSRDGKRSRSATSKRSNGGAKTGRPGTTGPPSTSRGRSKSVGDRKSKASRSKATKERLGQTTRRKSKKVEESEEEEEDEHMDDPDDVDSRPAKRPRQDAGPSRPPTIWITGGHKIHDGPNPPDPAIQKLQSQQQSMETRLDRLDSHFTASTLVQQQMLEALQKMSLSLQRIEKRPLIKQCSSTGTHHTSFAAPGGHEQRAVCRGQWITRV